MKGRLIIINWLIVLILIFAFSLVIGMAVSAFYHPKSVLAPDYNIASQIWTMFTFVSFLLAITLSITRNISNYGRSL
ncbi:hypothetical protein NIES4102_35490 [Chondrocystis sp. NIES-4102]|nr:hypothetical protein NIES4102_35490 [Chondrocystis sp. NIES-4102]